MKDINKQVGEKIRQLRYKAKYSHKEISAPLGLSIATLSKMENGLTEISIRKLVEIVEFYGVKLIDVLPDKLLPNDVTLRKQLEESREAVIELQGQLLRKDREGRYKED